MEIKTLVGDIYRKIESKDGWFTDELRDAYALDVGKRLQAHLNEDRMKRKGRLRLSAMGLKCPKALWYSVHHPELAEPLPATAEIKFAYGHMIEALVIVLAKASDHEVTGEQDEVELDGVLGHRDCIIDGCIVDVKSASSLSFKKFKASSYEEMDTFGYLDQLDGYVVASLDDPLVRVKDKAYLLAVDKTSGEMYLYEHRIREENIRARVAAYKRITLLNEPPSCECGSIPDGESGNIKLDVRASYNAFKHICFPKLRTFIYSGGPRYLTTVVRRPYDPKKGRYIPEVDKHGTLLFS